MKILLTNPPWEVDGKYGCRAGSRWPFLGGPPHYVPYPFFLGYATSYLLENGINAEFYDAIALHHSTNQYYEHIDICKPDIVLIETSTPSIAIDLRIAEKISRDCEICLTGPHASTFADDLIKLPYISYILKGEYERSSLEMCTTRRKGVYEPNYFSKAEIDSLPFPYLEEPYVYNYKDGILGPQLPQLAVNDSRGCLFKCDFCVPGGEIIIVVSGANKKAKNVRIGDVLMGYNEEKGILEETIVSQTMSRDVVGYLEIILDNNKKIRITEDHPIYTQSGWIKAKDLKDTDLIMSSEFNDKISLMKMGNRNPMKNKEIAKRVSDAQIKNFKVGKSWCQTVEGIEHIKHRVYTPRDPEKMDKIKTQASIRMTLHNPMKDKKIADKASNTCKKKIAGGLYTPYLCTAEGRKKVSERQKIIMKTDNPMVNPEIVAKNRKTYYANNSDKKDSVKKKMLWKDPNSKYHDISYMNSLCNAPNKFEKSFIDNAPENLKSLLLFNTGNIRVSINKNNHSFRVPDFPVVENGKVAKVIELGHFGGLFGKTPDTVREMTKEYEDLGISCLYVSYEKFLRKSNREKIYNEVQAFIGNPNCLNFLKIKSIKYIKKDEKVYNFSCYPHNNYFVNYSLVHNCMWPQVMYDGSQKTFSNERILMEIEDRVKRFKFNDIFFDSDTFGVCKADKIIELSKEVKKFNIPWTVMSRADLHPLDVWLKLFENGCYGFRFGIESFAPRINKLIGKKENFTRAFDVIRGLRKVGARIHLCTMGGFPTETDAEKLIHEDALKEMHDLGVGIQKSWMVPFPGTRYYKELKEKGMDFIDHWDWYSGDLDNKESKQMVDKIVREYK